MRTAIIISALFLTASAAAGTERRPADPLAGSWQPVRIGVMAIPAATEARLVFGGGSEYSTQAGCGNFGGFYSLDGPRIRVRQRDPVRTAKCPDRASARLETALAGFVAAASTYALLPDGRLRMVARDGRAGLFRRPLPAVAALEGRWTMESIGPDSPPPRPARLQFRENWVSAAAGCNSFGARVDRAGAGFTVSGSAATEMACDAERMAFDGRLFAAVGKARRWTALPGGRVRLEGEGEPLLLRRAGQDR